MSLSLRRLIYLAFLLIFFVVTPVLILSSAGYRYNFKKNKLEKVGILSIESKPRDVSIYINDQLKKTKTPAQIGNLFPDEYIVRIEKQGFHPWVKKLKIESNKTTFAKEIVLFKKSLPSLKISGEIGLLEKIPNQKIIYSIANKNTWELKVLDLKTDQESLITVDDAEFNNFRLSNNKKKALISISSATGKSDYLILNFENFSWQKLSEITQIDFEDIKWDSKNDNLLYGLKKEILYQINLYQKETKKVLSSYIQDFLVQDNIIYYISKVGDINYLNKIVLDSTEQKEGKIKLAYPEKYIFKESGDKYLILLNERNQDLFIIKPEAFDSQNISENIILQAKANEIEWDKNFKNLIYYNNFELWTYDLKNQKEELITRYSQEIKNVRWHPLKNYIIYQLNNSIRVIELDSRGQRNDIKLAELEKIENLIIDTDGKKVYFKGKVGNQQGIYELEITD